MRMEKGWPLLLTGNTITIGGVAKGCRKEMEVNPGGMALLGLARVMRSAFSEIARAGAGNQPDTPMARSATR